MASLILRGDRRAVAEERLARGHVEEGLVEREPLDERRERAEDAEDRARSPRRSASMRGGHDDRPGGTAAAPAMGIAECTPKGRASYDAAVTTPRRDGPPTRTGLPAQRRVVVLLDGRVERVHVDVQNLAGIARAEHPRVGHGQVVGSTSTPSLQ